MHRPLPAPGILQVPVPLFGSKLKDRRSLLKDGKYRWTASWDGLPLGRVTELRGGDGFWVEGAVVCARGAKEQLNWRKLLSSKYQQFMQQERLVIDMLAGEDEEVRRTTEVLAVLADEPVRYVVALQNAHPSTAGGVKHAWARFRFVGDLVEKKS